MRRLFGFANSISHSRSPRLTGEKVPIERLHISNSFTSRNMTANSNLSPPRVEMSNTRKLRILPNNDVSLLIREFAYGGKRGISLGLRS